MNTLPGLGTGTRSDEESAMKVRVTAQLLCGLALVCGCSGGDAPSEPASATVSGVVRDQASGAE